MKHLLLPILPVILFILPVQAQHCTGDNRYTQTPIFSDNQIDSQSNIAYGNAVNWQGQNQRLVLNVFYPKLTQDPLAKRPFVLMIHGGGFVQGEKEDMDFECLEFAKRGFVAATINYRLGHNCNQDDYSYDKAVYRAQQDARAAMRFAVEHATDLRIDTAWMFIGGGSAGAGTSLGMVYVSQTEWNNYRPNVVQELGPLDSSGNTLVHLYSFKAVFNNWAAAGKNYIQPNEMLPMVSFHGDADPNINIDSSYNNSCINPPLMYGSRALHQLLLQYGICSDLSVEIGGGHGIYTDASGTQFRVGRASCFFKSLFCGNCSSFYSTDSIAANCGPDAAITDMEPNGQALLYPNPAGTVVYMYAPILAGSEGYYQLQDLNGHPILRATVAGEAWQQPLPIHTESLPNGLYVVVLGNSHKQICRKLLVQN